MKRWKIHILFLPIICIPKLTVSEWFMRWLNDCDNECPLIPIRSRGTNMQFPASKSRFSVDIRNSGQTAFFKTNNALDSCVFRNSVWNVVRMCFLIYECRLWTWRGGRTWQNVSWKVYNITDLSTVHFLLKVWISNYARLDGNSSKSVHTEYFYIAHEFHFSSYRME